VLGCLIEKRFTTPEQYPLTLNALRLACNQATNRDPVVAYDEETVHRAAQRLCQYGLARLASGHSSRAIKYRHLAEDALGLGREELAVLAVLLLRGPQTPGELKARSERMAPLESLEHVEVLLEGLIERGYARRLPRRPGQKEDRFAHRLGADEIPEAEQLADASSAESEDQRPLPLKGTAASIAGAWERAAPAARAAGEERPDFGSRPVAGSLEARLAALEAEVAELRAAVAELRRALA